MKIRFIFLFVFSVFSAVTFADQDKVLLGDLFPELEVIEKDILQSYGVEGSISLKEFRQSFREDYFYLYNLQKLSPTLYEITSSYFVKNQIPLSMLNVKDFVESGGFQALYLEKSQKEVKGSE